MGSVTTERDSSEHLLKGKSLHSWESRASSFTLTPEASGHEQGPFSSSSVPYANGPRHIGHIAGRCALRRLLAAARRDGGP